MLSRKCGPGMWTQYDNLSDTDTLFLYSFWKWNNKSWWKSNLIKWNPNSNCVSIIKWISNSNLINGSFIFYAIIFYVKPRRYTAHAAIGCDHAARFIACARGADHSTLTATEACSQPYAVMPDRGMYHPLHDKITRGVMRIRKQNGGAYRCRSQLRDAKRHHATRANKNRIDVKHQSE